MALISRWAIVIALACGVLGVTYLPPAEDTSRRNSFVRDMPPGERARFQKQAELRSVRFTLATAIQRDLAVNTGVLEATTSAHATPNAPDAFVRFLEERLADFVSTVPRQRGSMGIFLSTSREVAAASPTLARYGGWFNPSHNYSVTSLMPPSVNGRTCLMLVTLTDRAVSLESSGTPAEQVFRLDQRGAGTAIGPCAFFAVFGQPGKGVQGWLRQTAFVWALRPSFASSAGRSTLDVLRQTTVARSRSLVERASFDAVGCAAGDEARCLRAVRSPVAALPIRMGAAQQLPQDWATSGTNPWTRVWFAGEEEYFLSDMVESLGYDRFQAFWSSDAPLDEAFAAATGIPLGRWIAGWARRTIGSAEVGPWPGRANAAIALLVTSIFVVAGAFIASRRTV